MYVLVNALQGVSTIQKSKLFLQNDYDIENEKNIRQSVYLLITRMNGSYLYR